MAEVVGHFNPAKEAGERALTNVYGCLERKESFLVEAGAGAGKTYALVKALHFLIDRYQHTFPQRHQKIACITFTNVAKEEIVARTDRSPLIYCNTIHAFCWSLISGFQRQLRELLPKLRHWSDRISEVGDFGERAVEYELGHRSINDRRVSIHHDDVIVLTITLMDNAKFRRIMREKYPIILIDEYQDTDADWIDSIKSHFLGQEGAPQFGFFGDHWQKIYGDGCGKIEHPSLTVVGVQANFRSVSTIVDCLNRMRPELPQHVVDPNEQGDVHIFHTNTWKGGRQTGGHWGGDLPSEAADRALQMVVDRLAEENWDLSPESTKILMLTHRVLASKQGYHSIPTVFTFNDSFTNKEHPHIAYFTDCLEPACEAYLSRKYGEMFRALGSNVPAVRAQADKKKWSEAMGKLIELRDRGTVGDVVDYLLAVRRPRLPDAVERLERELRELNPEAGEEVPRALKELGDLRAVAYQEIVALCRYLSGHSPFETKHGVKGSEFENVLVVVGRGWNRYNFNEMLELAGQGANIPANKQDSFERNRNLFYVTCSRPKRRLTILFTQQLSNVAMQTVRNWFGNDAIEALNF
ncbi:DNA helicase II [Candidatus Tenderia electrophaga]|jgi:DNA helicase-2/ATP-dependent DNA helicase PcrA|uniref:DNA 3'-5' helicase II n=1 Tax=Candidatus Tenderia electrophaga TaxID=1748243 RepID=A0A0S2TFU3_9GAMM|nr:DNA helicase II [Candidatus Tenderia electrophaga]